MAHLYRKTYSTTDPRTGDRITKKRRNWRVRYRDADGQMRDVPAFRDRLASQQLANDIDRRVAREKIGLVDRFDVHRGRPLGEHLHDYEEHLHAKGNTPKYVILKIGRINRAIEGCGFATLGDIVPSRVEGWLAGERDEKRLSAQTSNHYLTVLKGFCVWLVRERRAPDNPLVGLSGVNVQLDPKHQRRVLTEKDLAKFLAAAREGQPFRGLAGRDRVMLYRVVLYTGLRLNEVATLTKESFDLKAEPPTVTVEAGYSKRRKRDVLVLRRDLAADLKKWLRWKRRGEPVFQGTWHNRASAMVKADVEAAKLPYQDEAGRYFDFHSLRHQFVSSLAAAGVHPRVAQQLARHSSIELTMNRYSHVDRDSEVSAVEVLPGVGDGKRRRVSA